MTQRIRCPKSQVSPLFPRAWKQLVLVPGLGEGCSIIRLRKPWDKMAVTNNRHESVSLHLGDFVSCCSAIWAACLRDQILINSPITYSLPQKGILCSLFSWLVLCITSSCSSATQLLVLQLPVWGVLAVLQWMLLWGAWLSCMAPTNICPFLLIPWTARVFSILALDPSWFYSGVEKGRREGNRGFL